MATSERPEGAEAFATLTPPSRAGLTRHRKTVMKRRPWDGSPRGGTLSIPLGEATRDYIEVTYNARSIRFLSIAAAAATSIAASPMSLLKYETRIHGPSRCEPSLAASGEETPSPRRSAERRACRFIRAAHADFRARARHHSRWAPRHTRRNKAQTPTSVVYSNEWSRGNRTS